MYKMIDIYGVIKDYTKIALTQENQFIDGDLYKSSEYPTVIYYYRISAVDTTGNESTLSSEISVRYAPIVEPPTEEETE